MPHAQSRGPCGSSMAASGIMDHGVAGSFASRLSAVHTPVGTKTWAETFQVGVAVARNDQTRYKTFWAMVIAEKSPKRKDRKVAAAGETLERGESLGTSENP